MKKPYKTLCILVLFIFVCLDGTGSISGVFAAQTTDTPDEQAIRNVINLYFSLRYEAFQTDEFLDLFSVIDNNDIKTIEWLKFEADKRDIVIKSHTESGVRILSYRFNLDFKSIEIKQNTATVVLAESNEITYENNLDYPSHLGSIEHAISMKKVKDKWLIANDVYEDDLTRLMKTTPKSEIFKNIDKNHSGVVSKIPVNNEYSLTQQDSESNLWYLFPYDSSKAITYADNNYNNAGPVPSTILNAKDWNPSWLTSYKVYEGPNVSDCTNFVSQAVFEGVSG